MPMSIAQYWRVIRARWVLVSLLFTVIAVGGSLVALSLPRPYSAEAALVVDVRPDPVLNFVAPTDMATQIEILKSEKVATRAVQLLGMDKNPEAKQQWLEETDGRSVPMERYFATSLQRAMKAEPVRLSNVVLVTFYAPDSAFAAAAANAFAQAAIDVSVELKSEPAKQDAIRFAEQANELRLKLEAAQSRLTKYQQEKGIVISDGQMDQENMRLNAITTDLATAQAEQAAASARGDSRGEASQSALTSSSVQAIRALISAEQAVLSGNAGVWGPAHPERLSTEAKIASLQRQLNSEISRASQSDTVSSATASRKVSILKTNLEEQKKRVLALRYERDRASVLLKDVEAAQRAYEEAGKRISEASVRGNTTQANISFLTRAVEPYARSNKKMVVGIVASIFGGLALGVGAAIGLEMLDRRVRGAQDMAFMYGVPLIGVLYPEGSQQPIFRQLGLGANHSEHHKPIVPLLGAR